MDLASLISFISSWNWLSLIFKLIAILFSAFYFIYSLIFQQQLVKMERNALIYYYLLEDPEQIKPPPKPLIYSFSLLQLFIGAVLLLISLFLI